MFYPIKASYYSPANRNGIEHKVLPTLESVEELYGDSTDEFAFRNVIVGAANECAVTWQSWLAQKIFVSDEQEGVYVLRTDYHYEAKKFERWALFGAIDVAEEKLFVHEDVYPDRVRNTQLRAQASQADLSPIMLGYNESIRETIKRAIQNSIATDKPVLSYTLTDGTGHTLWRIDRNYKAILDLLSEEDLFLLDGHHRYQSAIDNYRAGIGDGRLLAFLTSMGEPDLLIHPFHRAAIYEPWINPAILFEAIESAHCQATLQKDISPTQIPALIASLAKNQCFVLPAQDARVFKVTFPEKKSSNYLDKLVVENIENSLFSKYPGMTVNPALTVHSCLQLLANAQAQAAFFLPPVTADEVRAVAHQGLRLPRKSTRFFPKPPLGLIARVWN